MFSLLLAASEIARFCAALLPDRDRSSLTATVSLSLSPRHRVDLVQQTVGWSDMDGMIEACVSVKALIIMSSLLNRRLLCEEVKQLFW